MAASVKDGWAAGTGPGCAKPPGRGAWVACPSEHQGPILQHDQENYAQDRHGNDRNMG